MRCTDLFGWAAGHFYYMYSFKFSVQGSVRSKYILTYIQQDATLHSLFISGYCSMCFGWYLHPSSGAHTTVSAAPGTCQTISAKAVHLHSDIQGVTGGRDQTSGECSLGQTIPI